jgi:hypothetical protein
MKSQGEPNMKKIVVPLAAATLLATATPAFAGANTPSRVNAGQMLYGSNGQRIASIYRVNADGNPQIVLDGKLITVPVSTLSNVDGRVTTSLTKAELSTTK